VRLSLLALLAALAACAFPRPSLADGTPGDFDFYVLSLSWSPTYCAIDDNPDARQCRSERHGFVVHGLWPQYHSGSPEYCRSNMDRWVSDAIVDSVADIMPDGGLVGAQWRKHGICSGLEQPDYFDLVREAYDRIDIPKAYRDPDGDRSLAPGSIETAFIDANPGLKSDGIAVACKQNLLVEVRFCLTRDLDFRDCRGVNRYSCRAPQIGIPAID